MSAHGPPWLKICGITREEDALLCVEAGVDAIGLNFVSTSKRRLDAGSARRIADAVRGKLEIIAVVADESAERLAMLEAEVGVESFQLHGAESPAAVAALPRAFKAIGVASPDDVALAEAYPGERLLVDSKVSGQSGGSGEAFDWSLVAGLSARRRIILAGGLTPENVAAALVSVSPFGVDVASGVERSGAPREKDADKLRRFVENARRAR